MNFSESLKKHVACDNIKKHKKSGLHTLCRKHNFRKTAEGRVPFFKVKESKQFYFPIFFAENIKGLKNT